MADPIGALSVTIRGTDTPSTPPPTPACFKPFFFNRGIIYEQPPITTTAPRPYITSYTAVSILVCSGVSLWIFALLALGGMTWAFVHSVSDTREVAMPFVLKALNHTLNVLTNADRSSVGAAQMISGVQSVTDLAIPAMRTALNQSILIIERLEALASHPVLQLSLK